MAGFTTITVTGSFERPDGQAAQGTVTATLSTAMQNGTTIVDSTPIVGWLNAAGALKTQNGLAFTLLANDDTGTTPTGSSYLFTVDTDGEPIQPFSAVLAHTLAGGTVDLTALY